MTIHGTGERLSADIILTSSRLIRGRLTESIQASAVLFVIRMGSDLDLRLDAFQDLFLGCHGTFGVPRTVLGLGQGIKVVYVLALG